MSLETIEFTKFKREGVLFQLPKAPKKKKKKKIY
jgi:hypothetical protein